MSDATLQIPRTEVFPERRVARETDLDRWASHRLAQVSAAWTRVSPPRFGALVRATRAAAPSPAATDADLKAAAAALSARLRAGAWPPPGRDVAAAFALVREAADRVFGTPHFDVQVMGAGAMVAGRLAEMQTGEGKTLTATLAAVAAGLAGIPVHVITSNDYLARRDAEEMEPLYAFFGLRVGCVVHGVPPDARREAYRADVTYCCNKEAAFDYLRDRIALRERSDNLHLRLEPLAEEASRRASLLHRGLPFAIVDEADSVLIDEARIPLIISRTVRAGASETETYAAALDIARHLDEGRDYRLHRASRYIELFDSGRERVAAAAEGRDGAWRVPVIREDLVRKALAALRTLERDRDYLVRDGKVAIVDEYTGRLMPDRSWSEGLHQMVEVKEGVALTDARETLARMTYQRFFRRYRWLAGMTGTAVSVAAELRAVYGLTVVRIPTNRPPRRTVGRPRVLGTAAAKWRAVADRAAVIHATGAPVLIGTRSVEASKAASDALTARGLAHVVLNADQDAEEAAIVAAAGERGAVTVATNMAGRGTDIKLGTGVEEVGGLHVIMTERHDSARIDRQLAGRCGRQGQPGRVEIFLSMEDELLAQLDAWSPTRLARLAGRNRLFEAAQRAAERRHAAMRRELLRIDGVQSDVLAFAGDQE